jgi:hypothetical protein
MLASEDTDSDPQLGISRGHNRSDVSTVAATGGKNSNGSVTFEPEEAREYNVMPIERAD